MSNALEPDRQAGEPSRTGRRAGPPILARNAPSYPLVPHDAETETVVITTPTTMPRLRNPEARERRFTAPGHARRDPGDRHGPRGSHRVFQTNQAPTPCRGCQPECPENCRATINPATGRRSSVRNAPGAGRCGSDQSWRWRHRILGTAADPRQTFEDVAEDQVRQAIQSLDIAIHWRPDRAGVP